MRGKPRTTGSMCPVLLRIVVRRYSKWARAAFGRRFKNLAIASRLLNHKYFRRPLRNLKQILSWTFRIIFGIHVLKRTAVSVVNLFPVFAAHGSLAFAVPVPVPVPVAVAETEQRFMKGKKTNIIKITDWSMVSP